MEERDEMTTKLEITIDDLGELTPGTTTWRFRVHHMGGGEVTAITSRPRIKNPAEWDGFVAAQVCEGTMALLNSLRRP
jgi:hypothetical protein